MDIDKFTWLQLIHVKRYCYLAKCSKIRNFFSPVALSHLSLPDRGDVPLLRVNAHPWINQKTQPIHCISHANTHGHNNIYITNKFIYKIIHNYTAHHFNQFISYVLPGTSCIARTGVLRFWQAAGLFGEDLERDKGKLHFKSSIQFTSQSQLI